MIVCVCHRVTESQIATCASSGCLDFDELQDELRVATACGACMDCAIDTFQSARSARDCTRGVRGAAATSVLALAAA